MNASILIMAIAIASQQPESPTELSFPTAEATYISLREINAGFLEGKTGADNWSGFVPLFSATVREEPNVQREDAWLIESNLVSRFTLYSFACEHDEDMVKADFGSREKCVELMSQFSLVRCDTNVLFSIADWLGSAVPLDTSKETKLAEMEVASKKDSLMVYGGKPAPRYPGSLGNRQHIGAVSRKCVDKFRFRDIYNNRLPGFRAAALKHMHTAVFEGYVDLPEADREMLWKEFCRRSNSSPQARRP